MDELSCRGNENALVQCRYDDNVVGCSHDNDAGARCYRSGDQYNVVYFMICLLSSRQLY